MHAPHSQTCMDQYRSQISQKASSYLTQSLLHASNHGSGSSARRNFLSGERGDDTSNIGENLGALEDAAVAGLGGEDEVLGDQVGVGARAGNDGVGSSAGESHEGGDDYSGEMHVE